jgi:hypothetical protein
MGLLFAPCAGHAQATGASAGRHGTLVVTPADIYAGPAIVGQTKAASCTATNSGTASLTISKVTSSNPAFRVFNLNLPRVLGAGQSVPFTVQFTPQALEYVVASVLFVSNASNPGATLLLHGTGVPAGTLVASPSPVFFGKVAAGGRKQMLLVVKNVGYSDVTISKESLAGASFGTSGLTLPLTLTPAESITLSGIFTPISDGVVRGSIVLTSNGTNPSLTVPIFGTGLVSVSLSWAASASAVSGYNVYRSRTSGGPYHKLTSAPDVNTSYNDDGVVGSRTYYYVVTSVNRQGVESNYSEQAIAVVPGP